MNTKGVEEVKIPVQMQGKIKEMLVAKQSIESQLGSYVQGFLDSSGLSGNWELNMEKWTMTPRKEDPLITKSE